MEKEHRDIRAAAVNVVSKDVLQAAQKIDWAFHDQIIDAMGNPIISDIHRVNVIKIRLIRNNDTRMLPELVVPVLDEHLAIFAALKNRNGSGAVKAIHSHIDGAKRRALGI